MNPDDHPLHLKEVRAHFGAIMVVGWVAVLLLLVAILGIADQLTRPGMTREVWPDDIPITAADALQLDTDEQAELDAALLGSAVRPPLHPLEHLPPIPPAGGAVLWQSIHDVSTHNEHLQQMTRCITHGRCAADEIASLGRSALPVIGTGTGPCAYEPRVQDNDKRVPTGLLAIVLGWVPDCHDAAIAMFKGFEEQLPGNLAADQRALGELYARFQIAKLDDGGNSDDTRHFAQEMSAVVSQVRHQPALHKAYKELRDVPPLGLSMAEIRAESMWAQARVAAQQGTAAQLGKQIAGLFKPEIILKPPDTLDTGHGQLQLVWCALALRAGADAGVSDQAAGTSDTCLQTLVEQRSALPASVVCGLTVRQSLRHGRWSPPECDLDNPAVDPRRLMRRLAASPAVWRDALQFYDTLPSTSDKRPKLRMYLETYAYASGSRLTWLAHEHRGALVALVLALALPVTLAVYLVWLWGWQLPALTRVLPPPLELDR